MKILILGNQYYTIPAVDGGAIEKLVEFFLDYNDVCTKFDITVIAPKSRTPISKSYNYTKFKYFKVGGFLYFVHRIFNKFKRLLKITNDLPYIDLVKKYLNKVDINSFDYIIVENEITSVIPLSKVYNGKILLHLHNDYLNVDTYDANNILSKCYAVLGVSKYICNRVKEIDINSNVKLLYNGVELNDFYTTDKNDINVLKQYNVEKGNYILFTGRLMPEKGVLELIKSYNKLNNPVVKLLIVGGSKRDLQFSEDPYIQLLIKEANSNSNIIFTDKVKYDLVKVFTRNAFVQVVPSIWNEAFGLTVAEGMASSNIMIVSNSGGIPELVDKNSGFIVERENLVDDIFDALNSILNNPSNYDSFKSNVYNKSKIFSVENYVSNFEQILKELKDENK